MPDPSNIASLGLLGGASISQNDTTSSVGWMPQAVREVIIEVPVEKIVERVVDRIVEVPTIVHVPATIPGLPEGEAPQVEMVDGVPLLAASRPLLEQRERVIAEREADNARMLAENARLAGEVEALSALFMAAAQ